MIYPNELRIGNVVYDTTYYCVSKICGIKIDNNFTLEEVGEISDPRWYEAEPEQIDPVPITPEWLERLGFKKYEYGHDYYVTFNDGSLFVDIDKYGDISSYIINDEGSGTIGVSSQPKYIHSLQNLYFALAGEELKIKDSQK